MNSERILSSVRKAYSKSGLVYKPEFRVAMYDYLKDTECHNYHLLQKVFPVIYPGDNSLYGLYNYDADIILIFINTLELKYYNKTFKSNTSPNLVCDIIKHEYIHSVCMKNPFVFDKFKDVLLEFYNNIWIQIVPDKIISEKIANANFNVARLLELYPSIQDENERKTTELLFSSFTDTLKEINTKLKIKQLDTIITRFSSTNSNTIVKTDPLLQKIIDLAYQRTFGKGLVEKVFYWQEFSFASEVLANTALIMSSKAKRISDTLVRY